MCLRVSIYASQDIVDLIEAEDSTRTDGSSIAGTLVRLAWHASGTYSKVRARSTQGQGVWGRVEKGLCLVAHDVP